MTCCFWRKTSVSVLAAAMAAITPLELCAATTYTVATGETFELASGGSENVADNRLDVSGSATLKLTGTATGGAFPLKLDIRFTSDAANAVLTVDASEVADCTSIRMTGDTRDNSGSATISLPSGMCEFVIGATSRRYSDELSFPSFEPNVSFAGEGAVVFTNDVAVVKLPTCTWRVANGARVATFGPNVLSNEDFSLSSYDVELCNPASFDSGATVAVPSGRTLYVRPCRFNNEHNGTWIGTSTIGSDGMGYITNNIALGGAGAKVAYFNNNDIYGIDGTVSGAGDVYVYGHGDVYMRGAFDWTGTFTMANIGLSSQAKYVFYPTNNASITPAIVVNHTYGGDFSFYPAGWPDVATTLRLTSFAGNGTTKYASIRVADKETITVGQISGAVRALYGGAGAKLVVESLAANATLYLRPNLDLTVKALGAGAKVVLESAGGEDEKWLISGPAAGDAVSLSCEYPENASESTVVLGGRLAFPNTEPLPFGAVTIREGSEISANIADGTKIVNEGGTLTQLVSTWRDKVTLWTDASDASTLTYAKVAYTNELGGSASSSGFTSLSDAQIIEWRDRREGKSLRFRTTKYDSSLNNYITNIFPYAQKTDGMDSIYFPNNGKVRMRLSTGKGENTELTVKYALFVYSGKLGGGNAFFCNQTTGYLQRKASQATPAASFTSAAMSYANAANLAFRTNGVDVAASTPLSGGWQMISFASDDGISLCAISQAVNPDHGSFNGGQIYAEILLFGKMPTEEERDAAETYLAKKWNLPLGHADVVQSQNVNVELSGFGAISLAGDAAVSNGMYSGAVNLNGRRLELSTNALPYTEATIPSDGRVLWIDPSFSGAVVHGGDAEKPDEVAYVYARGNDGLLTDPSSMCVASPYSSSADLRVRTVSGARASGTASTWLDFLNGYPNDNWRNHLQVKKDLSTAIPTSYSDTSTFVSINVKAGFFALDTTRGGGTVIASTVNGTGGSFKSRSGTPIWQSGCAAAVKGASAYLDGKQIDATVSGYSSCPEVFSFNLQESDAAQAAKVFGYSGTASTTTFTNPEIMGEWLLHSKRQSETDRAGIEAYLMKKWLGKLREGFSDFRGMTVSGDGVLAAVGPEYLPVLTSAFTGSLEFSRTEWSFTLPTDGSGSAVDAVDLGSRHVALPAAVVVNLDVTGSKSGTYVLMSAGSFAEGTSFSLGAVAGQRGRKVELAAGENSVSVKITAPGMIFLVR